jgi:undecaprenyl-diphosphatase
VLVNRPGNSSFTSSHAANHFGVAAYIVFTLKGTWGRWVYIFYLWAAVVCLAQVYVGVHFPIDLFCGGFVGFCIGFIVAKVFNKTWGFNMPFTQKQTAVR